MTDGKKTDIPGAPIDDSVPTETPTLLQQDLGLDRRGPRTAAAPPKANLKDTTPGIPSPATLKEASGEHPAVPPEYANTVISNRPATPSPTDFAKTVASAANPMLAKLQADRLGPRPPVPSQLGSPGVAAPRAAVLPPHLRDPSQLQTDPDRQMQPVPSRPQPLRQPLASRPLAPPVATVAEGRSADVITDPMPREAVPSATIVQRTPKTDPMQQPDVLAAMERSTQLVSKVAIPPPAPLRPPPPVNRPLPPAPVERTEVSRPAPPGVIARAPIPLGTVPHQDPTQLSPSMDRTQTAHPVISAPSALSERTQVGHPNPMPSAPSERTQVAMPVGPPGVPIPAGAFDRTEIARPQPLAIQPPLPKATVSVRAPMAPDAAPTAKGSLGPAPSTASAATPRVPAPAHVPGAQVPAATAAAPRAAAPAGATANAPAPGFSPTAAPPRAAAPRAAAAANASTPNAPAPAAAAPRAAAPATTSTPNAPRPAAPQTASMRAVAAADPYDPYAPDPEPELDAPAPRAPDQDFLAAAPTARAAAPAPRAPALDPTLKSAPLGAQNPMFAPTVKSAAVEARPAGPIIDAAPVARAPQGPMVTPAPAKQVSQQELTPVPPREAFIEPESEPVSAPTPVVTAPAPPPRPAMVVPPSFMDLPPAMEKPRKMGPDLATTQPGIPGPYSKPRLPPPEPAPVPRATPPDRPSNLETPSSTVSDDALVSDQVLATPASLWRRTFASVLDLAVIGGAVAGMLFLAVSVSAGKPVPNNLHGIDAFFFRLHPIAIPAAGLTVLLAVLYTTLGAFLLKGRTFGRLLFGIRLVDSSGKSPGVIRSLLRAVFAIVSFALFLAGFWLALFDRRGQTLHDKLTRTFVVRPV